MAVISHGRTTAKIEGDFVVFLIGMRVNRWWKIHKWLPVAFAMPKMLRELREYPEYGCLGFRVGTTTSIQYWRSFEHLESYAHAAEHDDLPAEAFNQIVRASLCDVGIWHETYLVRAGEYETVYSSIPRIGLAAAGEHVPVTARADPCANGCAKSCSHDYCALAVDESPVLTC